MDNIEFLASQSPESTHVLARLRHYKSHIQGSNFVPTFIIFLIALVPSTAQLQTAPSPRQGTEETVPCHTLLPVKSKSFQCWEFQQHPSWPKNQKSCGNPTQSLVTAGCFVFFDRCLWNSSLPGLETESCSFYFLQAKLKAAKQAKIKTTSITDNAGGQELDSVQCFLMSFYLIQQDNDGKLFILQCQTYFLKHSFMFLPAEMCVSVSAGSSANCSVSLLLRAF